MYTGGLYIVKTKKLKKWIKHLITAILLLIILFSGYNIFKIYNEERKTLNIQEEYKLDTTDVTQLASVAYSERYKTLYNVNSDFRGWVTFESGLIDLPFVQGTDNEFYLNHAVNKEYSSHGTIFQDYLQTLDSQNITLYGHYVYNNAELMFTPLATLTKKENYEANKYVDLYLKDTVRKYEIVAVLKYSIYDYPIYQEGDLSGDHFKSYKDYIINNRLYDTGLMIEEGDQLLTLQTCVRGDNDSRWVVVARLVSEKMI